MDELDPVGETGTRENVPGFRVVCTAVVIDGRQLTEVVGVKCRREERSGDAMSCAERVLGLSAANVVIHSPAQTGGDGRNPFHGGGHTSANSM